MPVTLRPKIRVRVLPSLLPLEIQLQVTADAIQWRYIGQDWVDLVDIEDINASVTIGTVTTLAPGLPATVTNVGTAQDAVLNIGIPAGEDGADGIVASVVAGTNVTIDNTDPANPIINAASGGGVSDGDHGDVVVSSSGTVWTIDTGVVTTAKMGGDVTAAGKALLDDADSAAQRATIGLGTTDNPQFNTVELGSASDTTVSRLSAGDLAIEGNRVFRAGGADVPVADGGTNISSYTTGDLLYASAAGVLSKLGIGSTGQVLKVAAGLPSWSAGAGFSSINIQTFTADGTYTPTSGMSACIAFVTGSGGAGGGKSSGISGCGGGGAGGTAIKFLTAADIGASKAVVVGAAATGGTSTGANGNSSSIGVLVSASGGSGGTGTGTGGAGGTVSSGNVNLPGGNGGDSTGENNATAGGIGGGSFWGSGAFGRNAGTSGSNGVSATVPGAGGSGGSRSTSGSTTGGSSIAGIVVIIEFIS